MKFIREIIAEKTNMASSQQSPAVDTSDTLILDESNSQEIDPVHMAASGGVSLNRANQFAFSDQDDMDDFMPGATPDEISDDQDDFDPLSEPQATLGQSEAEVSEAPEAEETSQLFADIWEEHKEPDVSPQEDETFDTAAEAPVSETPAPESNAQALMRTMYPDHDELPEIQEPLDASEAMAEPAEEEISASSPYQGIRRRQAVLPPEPEEAHEPAAASEEAISEAAPEPIAVPAPAAGRARRQAGRVKTRLLGFGNEHSRETDLFAKGGNAEPSIQTMFPVGWMVVISGPGRGTSFSLQNGVSQIGRGDGQAVRLDFGDNSISRENHAAVAYDPEQQEFFLGHGGKANLVRLNGKPVLSTEPLENGALIRIGETTLRFVALCGAEFDWGNSQEDDG